MDFGFYKMDCVEGMKQFKDNYFDLAIVDPPYANPSEKDYERFHRSSGGRFDRYLKHTSADWDKEAPSQDYFDELFRVSKHQIIWGGELLRPTTDALLYCVAQNKHTARFYNV